MGLGAAIALDGTPDPELAAASRIEVDECLGRPTVYRLRYAADVAEGDLPLLTDGRLGPGAVLSVLVPVAGGTECLVKGPVTGQRIHLAHGGAGSHVTVLGRDGSAAMDRAVRSQVWADSTDSDAVTAIAGEHGFGADVEATAGLHPESGNALVQRSTDLAFVRKLARRNGCLFWLTCNADGVETAHFKRPPLGGTPAAELVINLAAPSVQELDLEWDVERPTRVEAEQIDLKTLGDLDGTTEPSPLEPLGDVPLADLVGEPRTLALTAVADDAGDLAARAEATLIEAGFFVRARGRTSLATVGKPLRAHTLVNLRGAGSRHSGLYLVSAVRHAIDAAAHVMEFELIRNAWGAGNAGAGLLGTVAGLG